MARTHGLDGTYRWGCRCQPCTEAHRVAWADYYQRRIAKAPGPAARVSRYPWPTRARALRLRAVGLSIRAVARLVNAPRSTVYDWVS